MKLIKLLMSVAGRVTTAITGPFRALVTRAMRLFNINVITAKLIQPLSKSFRGMLKLRPRAREDYFVVGKLWIYKKLLAFFVLVLCAGVLIYFSMFAPPVAAPPAGEPDLTPGEARARADVTYDYNDRALRTFMGMANLRAQSGEIVYTGQIDSGAVTGAGTLYSRSGALVYEGEFRRNQYQGQGVAYYPDGAKKYEGEFSRSLYHGQGTLYSARGTALYTGGFRDGLYDGDGREFSENGALLYEGAFQRGERHGVGVAYNENGTVRYSGEFYQGTMQGTGTLCDGGKPVYIGRMYGGAIDYATLPGATLAELEAAFPETPRLFYGGGQCCFVFEQAGVIASASCSVRLDVQTFQEEAPAGRGFYLPGERAPEGWTRTSVTGMNWSIEGEPPAPSSSSDSSSGEENELEEILREFVELQMAQAEAAAKEQEQPEFVGRETTLYFEVDRDVWQTQEELDRTMVLISAVTALGDGGAALQEAQPLEDGGAPGLEDCVAIDFLRAQRPTAFPGVTFEMDRRSRLRVGVSAISGMARIDRRTASRNGARFDFAFEPGGEAAQYFTVTK